MRRKTIVILEEANNKMSGYAALFSYRVQNLCVKAEPASLLGVFVPIEGEEYPVERVAQVFKADDYHLALLPRNNSVLLALGKAVMKYHPEFKQEIKSLYPDEDGKPGVDDDESPDERILMLGMPEVDKERRDALVDGLKVLSEECNARLDFCNGKYTERINQSLEGAKEEEKKEALDSLKEIYDKAKKLVADMKQKKESEIEEAYQKYLTDKKTAESAGQNKTGANGRNAGMSMRLHSDDDE